MAARDAAVNGGDTPLWTLRTLDPNTAYLRMSTWTTYNSRWDSKGFLQSAFERLVSEAPANLIVDLRGNEGGTDVGRDITAHLIGTVLPVHADRRLVRYRKIPEALAPYLDTWDASFKNWGRAAAPFDDRFYQLENNADGADDRDIVPQAPRYRGHVWVIVDGSNSSATFRFDQLVQQRHLATLVGTPTGGNQRGIDGGAFFFVRLPNSGIEVDLPMIGIFLKTRMPDAGLTPDIPVARTAAGVAKDRDAAIDAISARVRRVKALAMPELRR